MENGLTMCMILTADSFMALQQLRAGKAQTACSRIFRWNCSTGIRTWLEAGFGDDWLRIGSVKVFMDGPSVRIPLPCSSPISARTITAASSIWTARSSSSTDARPHRWVSRSRSMPLGIANHEVLEAYEQLRNYESENHLPALVIVLSMCR